MSRHGKTVTFRTGRRPARSQTRIGRDIASRPSVPRRPGPVLYGEREVLCLLIPGGTVRLGKS